MLTDSALFVSAGDIGYLPMVPTSAYEAPRWSTLYFNVYFTVLGSTGSIIVLNPMKPTKDKTRRTRARLVQRPPFEVRAATRGELKLVLEDTLRIAIAGWPQRPKIGTAAQCAIS